MPKLQFNESIGSTEVTIPADVTRLKGWRKRLEDGEEVHVNFNVNGDGQLVLVEVDG